jgi:4-hydroxy-4-methyl-2-oxoglutarate aldolase
LIASVSQGVAVIHTARDRFPGKASGESQRFSAATVHEAAGRIGALPARLRPVFPGATVFGPAFPVLCPVGDNLWLHRALVRAEPGDVLVVQTTAADEFGYWGEILSEAAAIHGVAGLVLDGGVRDIRALERVGLAVFATGACIKGTTKNPEGRGRLGATIRLGEVQIEAGDLIVGDDDGVVCIPRSRVPEVLAGSKVRDETEARLIREIRSGATTLDLFGLPR